MPQLFRSGSPASYPPNGMTVPNEEEQGIIFHRASHCWTAVFHDEEMVQDVPLGVRKTFQAAVALRDCAKYLRSWPEDSFPRPVPESLLNMPVKEMEAVVTGLVNAKCLYPDDANERLNFLQTQKVQRATQGGKGSLPDAAPKAEDGADFHNENSNFLHQKGENGANDPCVLDPEVGSPTNIPLGNQDGIAEASTKDTVMDGSATESDAETMSEGPATSGRSDCQEVQGVKLLTNGRKAGHYLVYIEYPDGLIAVIGYHSSVLKAARLHDIVAIAQQGKGAKLNHPKSHYMLEEFLGTLQELPNLFPKPKFWRALKNGIEAGLMLRTLQNGRTTLPAEQQRPPSMGPRFYTPFTPFNRPYLPHRPPMYPGLAPHWPFMPRGLATAFPRMWGFGGQFGAQSAPAEDKDVEGRTSTSGSDKDGDSPSNQDISLKKDIKSSAEQLQSFEQSQKRNLGAPHVPEESAKKMTSSAAVDKCGETKNKGVRSRKKFRSKKPSEAPVRYVAAPTRRSSFLKRRGGEESEEPRMGPNTKPATNADDALLPRVKIEDDVQNQYCMEINKDTNAGRRASGEDDGAGVGNSRAQAALQTMSIQHPKKTASNGETAAHQTTAGQNDAEEAGNCSEGEPQPAVPGGKDCAPQRVEGLKTHNCEGTCELKTGMQPDTHQPGVTTSDSDAPLTQGAAAAFKGRNERKQEFRSCCQNGVGATGGDSGGPRLHDPHVAASDKDDMRGSGETCLQQTTENVEPNPGLRYHGVVDINASEWLATVDYKGDTIEIGRYAVKKKAAHMYDCVALGLFGADAKINFPTESYTLEEVKRALVDLRNKTCKISSRAVALAGANANAAGVPEEMVGPESCKEEEYINGLNMGTTRTGRTVRLPKRFREGTLDTEELEEFDDKTVQKPKPKKAKRAELPPKDQAFFRGEDLLMHYGNPGEASKYSINCKAAGQLRNHMRCMSCPTGTTTQSLHSRAFDTAQTQITASTCLHLCLNIHNADYD